MTGSLQRRLGLGDAVFIGLGSMVGAGVFSAFAPAAEVAGGGLLVGLAVAAVVAYCNATSTARLAALFPRAGGTYLYGREVLGEWAGFVAGWGFLIGKTASCAAMALTFAAYVAPAAQRPVAVALVVAVTVVNAFGITRTALATRVIVVLVLIGLSAVVVSALRAGSAGGPQGWGSLDGGVYGVLQAAGLLFFAFAGYARIATLGEEVRDPVRVIPRAVLLALAGAVVVYLLVGTALLEVLGAEVLARSAAPLEDAVVAAGDDALVPVVRTAAALASAGALLALVAGLGRTALAMAREGDLPTVFAGVHPRFGVPLVAELFLGAVLVALVATTDLRGVIGFSSFGVLTYYLIANVAALQVAPSRHARGGAVLGAVGCVVLVATLPWASVVVGLVVAVLGAGGRWFRVRSRRRRD